MGLRRCLKKHKVVSPRIDFWRCCRLCSESWFIVTCERPLVMRNRHTGTLKSDCGDASKVISSKHNSHCLPQPLLKIMFNTCLRCRSYQNVTDKGHIGIVHEKTVLKYGCTWVPIAAKLWTLNNYIDRHSIHCTNWVVENYTSGVQYWATRPIWTPWKN